MKRFRDYILSEQRDVQRMNLDDIRRYVGTRQPGHSRPMGDFAIKNGQPVVYRSVRELSPQYPIGEPPTTSVDATSLRKVDKGLYKRAKELIQNKPVNEPVNEMNALDTEDGQKLVAQVGERQARKLLRQEMISQVVSHIERQGLSVGRAQRTRQTRELLRRPTVGIDNSIRYADLSKKNPRLTQ
jgi:hypothetical protein